MQGNLSEEKILEFLASQSVGRIGCHANHKTYVVPISYASSGSTIFCHAEEGMKLNLMRTNPEVCFEVDVIETAGNWTSVIGWGRYEELSGEQRNEALKLLLSQSLPMVPSQTRKLTPNWPYPSVGMDDIGGVVFKIELREKYGRFEQDNTSPKLA